MAVSINWGGGVLVVSVLVVVGALLYLASLFGTPDCWILILSALPYLGSIFGTPDFWEHPEPTCSPKFDCCGRFLLRLTMLRG